MSTSTIGTVWAASMSALTHSAKAIDNVAILAEKSTNVAVLRVTIYETRESSRLQEELALLLQS